MAIKSLAAMGGAFGMFANKTLGKGLLLSGKGGAAIGLPPPPNTYVFGPVAQVCTCSASFGCSPFPAALAASGFPFTALVPAWTPQY